MIWVWTTHCFLDISMHSSNSIYEPKNRHQVASRQVPGRGSDQAWHLPQDLASGLFAPVIRIDYVWTASKYKCSCSVQQNKQVVFQSDHLKKWLDVWTNPVEQMWTKHNKHPKTSRKDELNRWFQVSKLPCVAPSTAPSPHDPCCRPCATAYPPRSPGGPAHGAMFFWVTSIFPWTKQKLSYQLLENHNIYRNILHT